MERYRTVMQQAQAEQVIERSRFIGHICPVSSREEADAFFARIRAQYRDATHNVPALVMGEQFNLQWASDDGEPQGTSGAPMVQMLVKEGVTDTAIMVTRYFGGIKLGTGGLVRAYTGTAKLVLDAAGICRVEEMTLLTVHVDYAAYDKIRKQAEESGFQIRDARFAADVTLELACTPERAEEARGLLRNLTGGKARETEERLCLMKEPVHSGDGGE